MQHTENGRGNPAVFSNALSTNVVVSVQDYSLYRVNYLEVGPNPIFLTMKDEESGSIKAGSYYNVWEKEGDSVALLFGVHFRPSYEFTKDETKRFIQTALSSMKQVGACIVPTFSIHYPVIDGRVLHFLFA
jgi:hypothetical protein